MCLTSHSYLDLYFDIILTADNIHLLTFLAQKVKSVRVESHTKSEVGRNSLKSISKSAGNTYLAPY
jgi:hypothetical protein